jgi:hypothetical protein
MWSRNKKIIIGLISVIIITIIGVIVLNKIVFALKPVETVTVSIGTETPDISAFFRDEQPTASFLTDINSIPMDKPGVHEILVQVGNKEYTSELEIEDAIPPEADVVNLEIWPDEIKKPEQFVENIKDATEVKAFFQEQPDFNQIGNQEVRIVLEDTSGNTTVKIASLIIKADTEEPSITGVQDQTVFVGNSISYDKGVEVTDNRDEAVQLIINSSAVNLEKAGQYKVIYSAVDKAENTFSVSAMITVKVDTEAPVIEGVKDQTVIVGENISYKKGVKVTDNNDESVQLNINSNEVNLREIGTYKVIYTASDRAGNTASETATIKIIAKPKVNPEELNKLADQVLSKILTPEMDSVDKAWAIFNWTIDNIQYTGSSDKSDWMDGAMRGLKKGTGDCFNYYATSRILLARAGFDNKTITRIDGKTQHYWNLVYINNNWYHFDTTPHYESHPYISFLRTDAELQKYDEEVKGYYKFDASKYPITPSEPLADRSKYVKE